MINQLLMHQNHYQTQSYTMLAWKGNLLQKPLTSAPLRLQHMILKVEGYQINIEYRLGERNDSSRYTVTYQVLKTRSQSTFMLESIL